jgi:hypothetical protein
MTKRRRPRSLVLIAVSVALSLALAGPALAGGGLRYHGHVREQADASVRMKLVNTSAGGEFVKPYVFKDVRMTCALGPHHLVISKFKFGRIPVADDAFNAHKHPSDVNAAVDGHLIRHGKAKGRLRVIEDAAGCDSGVLHWHAHTG